MKWFVPFSGRAKPEPEPQPPQRPAAQQPRRPFSIVVLGAGASKACGGPLTNEILPEAFKLMHQNPKWNREDFELIVRSFLIENFHLPMRQPPIVPAYQESDFPPLPLLLSLIDAAIERNEAFEAFGGNWPPDSLRRVRRAIEYMIFAVLDHNLEQVNLGKGANLHDRLLQNLGAGGGDVCVISLNYDIIVDNALSRKFYVFPDYGCDVATEQYKSVRAIVSDREGAELLKLHGSCNWMYCPRCHRLDVGISKTEDISFIKSTGPLFADLDGKYSCEGVLCAAPECAAKQSHIRPVMITPTHTKSFENPRLREVWAKAAEVLRSADRAVIVGYSLPPEDVEVIYLLKQGLARLPPERIDVVEFSDQPGVELRDHEIGKRYRALFGDRIGWHPGGFADYVARMPAAG